MKSCNIRFTCTQGVTLSFKTICQQVWVSLTVCLGILTITDLFKLRLIIYTYILIIIRHYLEAVYVLNLCQTSTLMEPFLLSNNLQAALGQGLGSDGLFWKWLNLAL